MKKPGIYVYKPTNTIWLIEKLEYFEKGFKSSEFTIILKGVIDGKQNINRCLITLDQYDIFEYIGEL